LELQLLALRTSSTLSLRNFVPPCYPALLTSLDSYDYESDAYGRRFFNTCLLNKK